MKDNHDKALEIANAMFGERNVCIYGVGINQEPTVFIEREYPLSRESFSPFDSATDSQAVLEWLSKYFVEVKSIGKSWLVETILNCTDGNINKDLKIAIAECAYKIVINEA